MRDDRVCLALDRRYIHIIGERLKRRLAIQSGRAKAGQVEGLLSLAGEVQNDATRRGRASVRAAGGELIRIPLLLPLIEVKALQAPTGESLDFATLEFVINGNTATTEYISIESKTVEVFGYGTVTLPDYDLDLALHTRSVSPWPIVSRFADVLFDEFSKVSITGRPSDVRTSVLAFPSSRRLLGTILSSSGSPPIDRLEHIERRAWQIRDARKRHQRLTPGAGVATIPTAQPLPDPPDEGRVAGLQEQP